MAEVASTAIPLLLIGESGTGKEVYSRLIHRLSTNCHKSLKKVNCRTIDTRELCAQLKSDLNGNSPSCEGELGTLFLDGVDELDEIGQKLLLSLLPDGENKQVNHVRLIAATCRNLDEEVETGRFRRELYFRINGVPLRLPPLRERKEDIPALLRHFLTKHAGDLGRAVPVVDVKHIEFLGTYEWPGNIRQLENLARQICVLGDTSRAIDDDIRKKPKAETDSIEERRSLSLKLAARAASRQAERELISLALERTRWNRKRAARDLQISYKSLLYKIKQTGLDGKIHETAAKEQL